jgi:hypothetical protein
LYHTTAWVDFTITLCIADRLGGRDRRKRQVWIADRRQRYKPDSVGIYVGHCGGQRQRQARLANTAGAGQRQQPDIRAAQQSASSARSSARPSSGVGATGREGALVVVGVAGEKDTSTGSAICSTGGFKERRSIDRRYFELFGQEFGDLARWPARVGFDLADARKRTANLLG